MPDNEPPDETPPDNTRPDRAGDQPAWMTPEGRLREIPIKNLCAGEQYTKDELRKLCGYWTEERTRAIAQWIDDGSPSRAIPECVPVFSEAVRVIEHGTAGELPTDALDLRAVDLHDYLCETRTRQSPKPELYLTRLEHATLVNVHLEHAQLYEVHLENALLKRAHLEHAILSHTYFTGARLGDAHLEHSHMVHACLEYADLQWAHLEHAHLNRARLAHADLSASHLEHADLTRATILQTQFIGVHLDATILSELRWQDERRRDPDGIMFRGFDVRGIRYSDPYFDQWVRQTNFIARIKEHWPKAWWWWSLTCKCGRSIGRWALVCGAVAVLFGLVFLLAAEVFGYPLVQLGKDAGFVRHPNPFTYFYFSVVTFTTLGFGDVRPTGLLGEILVTLEVILGYVGLGGLISIFTTKLIPPR